MQFVLPAAEELFRKYYPIETSPKLSVAEKLPHMVDWYHQVHTLYLSECNITRNDIARSVAQNSESIILRPGVTDIISWCERHSVPLVVLSAGVGNVIVEVLKQCYSPRLPPELHVVSNEMFFDAAGALTGFSEPVLHMFNKTGASLPEELACALRRRRHAILVGDSPGDASMADGLNPSTLLKIGLLNHDIAAHLPRFQELFDVLLLDDTGLEPVVDLLRGIAE